MDVRRLSYFVSILEEGSITAAAQRMRVSQPALTKAMKTLEDELGVVLFDRTLTGITPTNYGEALYGRSRAILAEMQRAQEEIATLRGMAGERFRIGALPTLAGSVVAKAVVEVTRRFPDLQVLIQEGHSATLFRALRRRELDVALVYLGNVGDAQSYECHTIFRDQLKVVAAPNHPLAGRADVTVEDLANQRWCAAVHGNWPHLERMFKAAGVEPAEPPVDPGGAVQFLKTVVLSGQYLSVLPLHAMTAELERGELVVLPVANVSLEREIVALRQKEPELPASGRAFLAALSRAAPKLS